MASIWKRSSSLDELNRTSQGTAVEHLGIRFTELRDDALLAEMPVDERTRQPFGLLHGGASALLAETLGSIASWLAVAPGQQIAGTELNASHLRAVFDGKVTGLCQPLHVGTRQHVWSINIHDDKQRLCCCARLTVVVL